MPIKQERMLTLLEAADAFSNTLRAATTFINETAATITPDSDRATLLQALHNIQQYFALSSIPHRLIEAIAQEKAHFKLNRARNERHARRSKLKRQGFEQKPLPNVPTPRESQPIALSDLELARQGHNAALTSQKIAINQLHKDHNMPEPYADVYDDSPLLPDHTTPQSDDSLF